MTDGHERRNDDKGPPSGVMQSYREMSKPDRRRLQTGGTLMVLVAVAYPFVSVLFVSLPVALWILDFVLFFVGVLFIWPPGGIWAAEKIPAAVMALVPSGRIARALGSIPDRRGSDRSDGGST